MYPTHPRTAVCNQDEIRLQGGQFETEGRVEICHLETWNTVCDNLWSNEDASVVCKQIGFSRHSESIKAHTKYKNMKH